MLGRLLQLILLVKVLQVVQVRGRNARLRLDVFLAQVLWRAWQTADQFVAPVVQSGPGALGSAGLQVLDQSNVTFTLQPRPCSPDTRLLLLVRQLQAITSGSGKLY